MNGKKIGYARVSTIGQTVDEQLRKLRSAGCDKIFQEKLSGATRERPALNDLLEFVRDGDTVYITKLDRLARNTFHLHEIVNVLDQKSVGFVVIDQPEIDTTSPIGRMLFSIIGAVASFERDLIKARTEEGKSRARKAGVKFGRPPSLSPEQLAELRHKFARNVPRSELAKEYGIAEGSVYRLCQHVSQPTVSATPLHAPKHRSKRSKAQPPRKGSRRR